MRALLTAGSISLAFTLFLTPAFIRLFRKLQWGQFIRSDGPQTHHAKRGTATMGGIIVILAVLVGYFVGVYAQGETPTISSYLVLFMMVGLGGVGFIDDFLKTRKQRSLGLGGWSKLLGQVIVAAVFAIAAINFPNPNGLTPADMSVSFIRDLPFTFLVLGAGLGVVAYVIWIALITTATSNGVNVADGLDGLATGSSIAAIGAYVFIGFWQFSESCVNPNVSVNAIASCYNVRDPLDLAIVAGAIAGALVGFLWWNTSPAQIFLGDTGSLALGGALAALAILSHTELLLLLIGGIFVISAGSVIIQRAYFKVTGGKRIFRMSPLHHHFELKGWAEVTVVVRFWIIAGLCVAAGLGMFYLEWLTR